MNGQKDSAALVGRVALALIFVMSGVEKLTDFGGTVSMIADKNVPLPAVAAAIAAVIELGGGLAIVAGWRTRWAALALAVFLIVISPIFHNFWAMQGEEQMMNQAMFMKNVSMLGGFLLLYAFGPGKYSVDKR
ncbi:MAG TPA: DoxX family protein [Casimicrobiaceae bacterium]|jgi:putative oxidoreductase